MHGSILYRMKIKLNIIKRIMLLKNIVSKSKLEIASLLILS